MLHQYPIKPLAASLNRINIHMAVCVHVKLYNMHIYNHSIYAHMLHTILIKPPHSVLKVRQHTHDIVFVYI